MIGFGSKPVAFGLTVGFVVAGACTRTEDPIEHYRATASAGTAAGGKGTGTAGKGTGAANTGGKPTGTGGSANPQGGDDTGLGGAGGDSGVVPETPTDFGCGEPPVSPAAKHGWAPANGRGRLRTRRAGSRAGLPVPVVHGGRRIRRP